MKRERKEYGKKEEEVEMGETDGKEEERRR
jgi:hypothetical protein